MAAATPLVKDTGGVGSAGMHDIPGYRLHRKEKGERQTAR